MLHTHFFLSDLQKTLRTLTTSVLSFLTRVLSSCSFQTKNTGQSACEQIGPKSAEMLAAQWFAVSDDIVRNLLTFLCIRFRFSCSDACGFESLQAHQKNSWSGKSNFPLHRFLILSNDLVLNWFLLLSM